MRFTNWENLVTALFSLEKLGVCDKYAAVIGKKEEEKNSLCFYKKLIPIRSRHLSKKELGSKMMNIYIKAPLAVGAKRI